MSSASSPHSSPVSSMAEQPEPVPNSVSQNVVLMPTFSGTITEKLTRNNYVLWLAQILPWLKTKGLMGFVEGTKPCPPAFLSDAEGNPTNQPNPEHLLWTQQDQMILLTINNSVTSPVLSTIARKLTSHEAWATLEKRFASSSPHRIQQLLASLYTTTRGESSVSEFLEKINQVADQLAMVGEPVSDSQLVMIIMQNIGSKFEMTISAAQARDTPIGYDDLVALLLQAEQRMNFVIENESPVALFAPKSDNSQNRFVNKNNRGRGSFSSNKSGQPNRGRGNYKGNQTPNQPRPKCQICDRVGHIAIDCYDRMNTAFEGRVPAKKLVAMVASSTTNNVSPSTWYTDSGASQHVTTDLANLAIQEDYTGTDKVAVGNGSGSQVQEDAF